MNPRGISEARQAPTKARQLRLLCPHCSGCVYITMVYPYTAEQRQRSISKAIDEHRRLCEKAPPEDGRVYRIDYPRA